MPLWRKLQIQPWGQTYVKKLIENERPVPCANSGDTALNVSAWDQELPSDYPDRDFVMTGVRDGFHIVDSTQIHGYAAMDNHASTKGLLRPAVEKQINRELNNGHYRRVKDPPNIVSPLGAIPKAEPGKIRLIHDASRPTNGSLNDYAYLNPFQYQSVQDAVDMIKPAYYMAKVDLSSAYRSVRIHPSNVIATGLKWRFSGDNTYMVDERLPFGARRSPEIFHRCTQAVKAMMAARGFPGIVVYLDDFILIAPTQELCKVALNTLLVLLR